MSKLHAFLLNMTFTENDKLKAMAIVHIFETSQPLGDFAACVVLNDGAGVSYGINQFTHRSGSLAAVIEYYLKGGGLSGRDILVAALPNLKKTSVSAISLLASDERLKRALRAAAATYEMKAAQKAVAFERYLAPAIRICKKHGFVLPLSLAVVYDSVTHGSWEWISGRVTGSNGILSASKTQAGCQNYSETAWITEYVRKRHAWLTELRRLRPTNYRTKFFLDQIEIGNWTLGLPMTVHGFTLTAAMIPATPSEPTPMSAQEAIEPLPTVSEQEAVATGSPSIDTSNQRDTNNSLLKTAAEKFDRVDNVVTVVTSRTDAAKSLWTTVGGTLWQSAWAIFGFVTGLPKAVWIVVAIIAAALMLVYLYRQIELGRIRERSEFTL